MERRHMSYIGGIGAAVLCLLGSGVFRTSSLTAQGGAAPSPPPTMTVPDGFTTASAGDLISWRPAAQNPDIAAVAAILRGADVAVGNFEGNAVDPKKYDLSMNLTGHMAVVALSPMVPKDLHDMGFKMLSLANNHTSDWGAEGSRQSNRLLTEAGVVTAGVGETRTLACAASYYETTKGVRVALVSLATLYGGADTQAIALEPNGGVRGRYGMCTLRSTRYTYVTPSQMQALKEIVAAYQPFPPWATDTGARLLGGRAAPPPAADELSFLGVNYKVGDKPGFTYKVDPIDERVILNSIRTARLNADFVIVTIHAHDSPADYLEAFARKAIDAGADQWLGHGPHILRGIEIYKNRPIYYGLAHLFYQLHLSTQPTSLTVWETRNADPSQETEADLLWRARGGGARDAYEGVIPVARFEKNQLVEVRLYPTDLGPERPWSQRGTPKLATGAPAQTVFKRLQESSRPYGTNITVENNVGLIRVRQQPSSAAGRP